MLARQHADGGTAGQEVLHHLPGDVAGIGRDAAGGQAVVARAHQHLRVAQARGLAAQHQPDLQRQRLQAPERAQGLGLAVQLVLQALRQRGVVEVLQGFDHHGHEGVEEAGQGAGRETVVDEIGQAVEHGVQGGGTRGAEQRMEHGGGPRTGRR